jgi:hypothetical protein
MPVLDLDARDLTGVAADLLAYATDNKEHLYGEVLNPSMDEGNSEGMIVPVSAYADSIQTSDRVVLTSLKFGKTLQRGGRGWTPKKDIVNFATRFLSVSHFKADHVFSQAETLKMLKSYAGALRAKKYDPETFPFEAEIMMGLVKKMRVEVREAIWNGVADAAGNDAEDVLDGWLKQIADAIASGEIPAGNFVAAGGSIDADNAIDLHLAALAKVPSKYRYSKDLICITSRFAQEMHEEGWAKKYTSAPYNNGWENRKVAGSNVPFIVETSFENEIMPIFTLKNNFVYGYDDESGQTGLDVWHDKKEREICVMTDFQFGCGIVAPELVWGVL